MRALAITTLAAIIMTASAASAAQVTLPSNLAATPKALWQAVMTGVYGPYDARLKCWVGQNAGQRYCMRPHRLITVTQDGTDRLFMAVGGQPADSKPEDACHACSGNLGLLVFEKRGDRLVLAASNGLYEESGSWGAVPAEEGFAVEKIGPQDFAWVIESGYTAQGVTGGGKEILAVDGDRIVSLGFIPTFRDDCGAVEEGQKCSERAYALTFGPKGSGRYYDAVAEALPGKDAAPDSRRFDVPFNGDEKKYKTPEALEQLLEM